MTGQLALWDRPSNRDLPDGEFRVRLSEFLSKLRLHVGQLKELCGNVLADVADRWGEQSEDYKATFAAIEKLTGLSSRTLARLRSKAQVPAPLPDKTAGSISQSSDALLESKIAGGADASAVQPTPPAPSAGAETGTAAQSPPAPSGDRHGDRGEPGTATSVAHETPVPGPPAPAPHAPTQDDAEPRATVASQPHRSPFRPGPASPPDPAEPAKAKGAHLQAAPEALVLPTEETDEQREKVINWLYQRGHEAVERNGTATNRLRLLLNKATENRDQRIREGANGNGHGYLHRTEAHPRPKGVKR